MPIILVTGLPGHGKTLYTIAKLRNIHLPPPAGEARAVFHASGQADKTLRDQVHGIPHLALPWTAVDPLSWPQLPHGALLVVDEAQFVFPVRPGRGEPPDFVAQLATHRHLGLDIYLITQHPKLLDPFVLRLVDQHFHVMRKFGTKFATVFEFSGVRDNVDKSRKDAVRHEWRYPKDVFSLYKSAEVHTVKLRLPMRFWVMLGMPFAFVGLAWLAYQRLNPAAQVERAREAAGILTDGGQAPNSSNSPSVAKSPSSVVNSRASAVIPIDGAVTLASLVPRVAGLPYTAPGYDRLTLPVEAPYPAYCVSLGDAYPCTCYTQRGTGLDVPRATCESIAKKGFFAYWVAPLERFSGDRADTTVKREPPSNSSSVKSSLDLSS